MDGAERSEYDLDRPERLIRIEKDRQADKIKHKLLLTKTEDGNIEAIIPEGKLNNSVNACGSKLIGRVVGLISP